MQLQIKRYQKKVGMLSKDVQFCVAALVKMSNEEEHAINEYGLGSQVVYNSEASRKHLAAHQDAHARGSVLKSIASVALARMSLNISIDSLKKGHVIECSSLDEAIAAEQALRDACTNIKEFIAVAQLYDGQTITEDF